MHIGRIILNVASPEDLSEFYTSHFGALARSEGENKVLSWPGQGAALELRPAVNSGPYSQQSGDRYWKIGITLPNVDIARSQLHNAGVQVSESHQFRDIGYMCHLSDPEGFSVELLQHHFEANRPANAGHIEEPLGGGAQIGQVTLRSTDITATLGFYRDQLGMTLLSVQPVEPRGFTLYFLAFTDDVPPNSNLEAAANREWLWQRPYTTLEIQHLEKPGASVRPCNEKDAGYGGLIITGSDCARDLSDEAGSSVFLRQ